MVVRLVQGDKYIVVNDWRAGVIPQVGNGVDFKLGNVDISGTVTGVNFSGLKPEQGTNLHVTIEVK